MMTELLEGQDEAAVFATEMKSLKAAEKLASDMIAEAERGHRIATMAKMKRVLRHTLRPFRVKESTVIAMSLLQGQIMPMIQQKGGDYPQLNDWLTSLLRENPPTKWAPKDAPGYFFMEEDRFIQAAEPWLADRDKPFVPNFGGLLFPVVWFEERTWRVAMPYINEVGSTKARQYERWRRETKDDAFDIAFCLVKFGLRAVALDVA